MHLKLSLYWLDQDRDYMIAPHQILPRKLQRKNFYATVFTVFSCLFSFPKNIFYLFFSFYPWLFRVVGLFLFFFLSINIGFHAKIMQLNELETALLGWKSASLIYGKRRLKYMACMRDDFAYLEVKEKRVIYIMLVLISKLQEWT